MKNVSTFTAKNMIAIALLGSLAACGDFKQDATRDYKDLGPLVKPHNNRVGNQEALGTFHYRVAPADDKPLMFIEGQSSTYQIESMAMQGADYDFKLIDGDLGMQLTKGDAPGRYNLTWTPKPGHVGLESVVVEEIALELILSEKSSRTALDIFQSSDPRTRTTKLKVIVQKNATVPVIAKVDGIKTTVNEGESFAFTIEVSDPSAHEGNLPELIPLEFDSTNTELFEADGNSFNRPEKLAVTKDKKSGNWIFHRMFDTRIATIPYPIKSGKPDDTASSVTVRLTFLVMGASGQKSQTKVEKVTINLNKKAELPQIRMSVTKPAVTFETGVERNLDMSTFAYNQRAKADFNVESMKKAIAGWPGNPEISCADNSRNPKERSCTFSWKPPCEDAGLKAEYVLPVEATTTLSGKTTTAKETKTLKIVRNNENCAAIKALNATKAEKAKIEVPKAAAVGTTPAPTPKPTPKTVKKTGGQ